MSSAGYAASHVKWTSDYDVYSPVIEESYKNSSFVVTKVVKSYQRINLSICYWSSLQRFSLSRSSGNNCLHFVTNWFVLQFCKILAICNTLYEIWSHNYEDYCLLGCYTMQFGKWFFRATSSVEVVSSSKTLIEYVPDYTASQSNLCNTDCVLAVCIFRIHSYIQKLNFW